MTELSRTPLHAIHRGLGARMVPFAGFEMPVQYDGLVAEHTRTREAVGLFDVSHMGEVRVTGPDALEVVNRLITNDLHRITDGRALYTCLCAEDGTIVDDLIVYRLSPEEIFICVNAGNRAGDFAHMKAHARGDATFTDEGERWGQIAVQGPRAPELLARVFGAEVGAQKPFRIRSAAFGDATVMVASTGYTGEPGGEVYAPSEVTAAVWEALTDAGRDLGTGPVGLGARDTLRLEMGYCLYGNDIDRSTTPLEAGLSWVVRLDKPEFVGKDALVAQRDAGVPRKLVGIEVTERGIPRHGYPVLHDGAQVGLVTSGTSSPTTGRSIGLALIPTALSELGTALAVDCRGKVRAAQVVPTPFYSRS
ncbi:MAG: glycine cleavage system aminomethyltransferase GcvT [Deltaproteobacteria bacterium]|nr:glycine cleavage system aminomethyltransferase GcvT [Deltaproteobacteria bacterium]MCB9786984.1 glycine cleavage system aminomethyltransferase GcvT [Deltaproteobacteria bacterium]